MVACVAPSLAFAHAVLTKASLDGDVRSETATAVTLRFNTGIEPKFTRVVLVDGAGAERPLDTSPGEGRATVRVALPPLAAGIYGLRYKVLAADGHVTESVLRFTVKAAE